MHEVHDFGLIVLLVSTGFALAVVSSRLSERLRVPGPAIFLIAAALLADAFPSLADALSIRTVERIGVVALAVILFDGGTRIGLRRFRTAAVPILSLGIVGTFATAGLTTLAAHWLLDFSWITSGLIGAAIAPTDPAVMFSVLGRREVSGRTGTILEAESGANDPVGIALMIGIIEFATSDDGTMWTIVREFALEMSIGLVVGVAGAYSLLLALRRLPLPVEGLYPLFTLAAAGVIYGLASTLHGSGFLAVFVAGILVGDERTPYQEEVESFFTSLASLAEIVMFVALGLTIDFTDLPASAWSDGVVLAVVVALVARPLVVWTLLLPTRLRVGERLFVAWGGLKGAVPIFLAAFAILAGVDDADRIYGIVFVVVALSVVIQGSTIPLAASLAGVPMRLVRREPLERPRQYE
jgi:cell volume regulation protein A